jgi:hypothetical protein
LASYIGAASFQVDPAAKDAHLSGAFFKRLQFHFQLTNQLVEFYFQTEPLIAQAPAASVAKEFLTLFQQQLLHSLIFWCSRRASIANWALKGGSNVRRFCATDLLGIKIC